jgi:mitochondrial import receptor subunit TOM40
MAAPGLVEKQPVLEIPVNPSVPPLDVTRPPPPKTNAIFDALFSTYQSFQERRAALGLTNPGTVEQIAKEVQRDVFLTNQTFSGLRAELNKSFSLNPV